jgi:hypothetical protein
MRVKKSAIVCGVALWACLAGFWGEVAQAQILTPPTMSVKKFSGDPVTFSWSYDVADEATISYFQLVATSDLFVPADPQVLTFAKTARTASIPAVFAVGSKFTYYALTAVDARDPAKILVSLPSNTVAAERVGKPPTNLVIQ